MKEWIYGEVIEVKKWTDVLFSLRLKAAINNFIAGQFTKIALQINGKQVQRAYSYVNSPHDPIIELYIVKVKNGKLSPYLYDLQPGDGVQITKESFGYFVIDAIPTRQILWMLATGTAIGPYLSILQDGKNLDRFEKIVLIHGVRYFSDLSFSKVIQKLKNFYKNKFYTQPVVSREKIAGLLYGRIPDLIQNGQLENTLKLSITKENSHVMLCGNPKMVHDTQEVLNKRGMYKHFKNKHGHISSENYW